MRPKKSRTTRLAALAAPERREVMIGSRASFCSRSDIKAALANELRSDFFCFFWSSVRELSGSENQSGSSVGGFSPMALGMLDSGCSPFCIWAMYLSASTSTIGLKTSVRNERIC